MPDAIAVHERLIQNSTQIATAAAVSIGMQANQVVDMVVGFAEAIPGTPGVILSIEDEKEQYTPLTFDATGPTGLEFVGFQVIRPVRVMFFEEGVSTQWKARRPFWLLARQTLIRAFLQPTLREQIAGGQFPPAPAVPELALIDVELGIIADPKMPEYQRFVSGFRVMYLCEEDGT